MPQLPRAILFDLDDTIIRAYGKPELAWTAVIDEFAPALAPLTNEMVREAVLAAATAFWADPAQHRFWRQRLREARREVVKGAFTALAARGDKIPSTVVQGQLADRFSDYRDEAMHIFPDAHTTIDS